MNLFTKKNILTGIENKLDGYQRVREQNKFQVWDLDRYTMINKQQVPMSYHTELYSTQYNNLYWKKDLKTIYRYIYLYTHIDIYI